MLNPSLVMKKPIGVSGLLLRLGHHPLRSSVVLKRDSCFFPSVGVSSPSTLLTHSIKSTSGSQMRELTDDDKERSFEVSFAVKAKMMKNGLLKVEEERKDNNIDVKVKIDWSFLWKLAFLFLFGKFLLSVFCLVFGFIFLFLYLLLLKMVI